MTGALVDQETTVSVTGVQSNIDTLTCNIAGSLCTGMSGTALINCCANTMSCCDVVDGDLDGTPADLAVCAAPEATNKDDCSPMNRLCQSPGEICDRVEAALKREVEDAVIVIHVEPEHKAKHQGVVVL